MVAKTFQNLEQVGEPFESGGKMYINVRSKNGTVRRVRWYDIAEYMKMYPDTSREEIDPYYKSMRRVLFDDYDFIWIVKGNYENKVDLLEMNPYVCYHTYWGWFVRNSAPQEIIDGLKEQFEVDKLYWKDVFVDDNTLKDKAIVEKIVKETKSK